MLPYYFEQFLDAFKEAVCISNNEGTVIYVNRKHSELTGIPKEKVVGRKTIELVENGYFDIVLSPAIVNSKKTITRVQSLSHGDKLLLEGHPIFNEDGEVMFVVTFIYDITTLSELKEQVIAQKELLDTFRSLQSPKENDVKSCPSIIHSKVMREIFGKINAIADTDATVLLLGDTGVGKDVCARRLHAASSRANNPFIKADCGSIPAQLIETELFGYAPGTFSGGNKAGKAGLIEAASSGTLFLDEIAELPLQLQSRLLRILQDGEVTRVGSTSPIKPNTRVIAATNKDLEREVAEGRFRSDLYYRLRVAVIRIPPLKERKADILPLAHCFLDFYCAKYKKKLILSAAAEQILEAYHWPGNVRELENLIHSLVITQQTAAIDVGDLPIAKPRAAEQDSLNTLLQDIRIQGKSFKDISRQIEDKILLMGLQQYGSLTEVAKHFKLDRATVFRRVKKMERELGYKLPFVRSRTPAAPLPR